MSFVSDMSKLFPRVECWIGQSHIHVSICRSVDINVGNMDTATILKMIKTAQVGEGMYKKFDHLFEGVEWLVDEETFSKLLLVLLKYELRNSKFETPDMIQNPVTGHFFHRIALYPEHNLVLGFRCWATPPDYDGPFSFGWRLRVASLVGDDEQQKVRVEVARRQKIVMEEIEEVYDLIAEVPEPTANLGKLESLYNYSTEHHVYGFDSPSNQGLKDLDDTDLGDNYLDEGDEDEEGSW